MFLEFELKSPSPSRPDIRNLISPCHREEYPFSNLSRRPRRDIGPISESAC
jgi:hypothetical protein